LLSKHRKGEQKEQIFKSFHSDFKSTKTESILVFNSSCF
jgi:uncharacterized membrane protein YesL